jgi:hypothetical protein
MLPASFKPSDFLMLTLLAGILMMSIISDIYTFTRVALPILYAVLLGDDRVQHQRADAVRNRQILWWLRRRGRRRCLRCASKLT